MSFAMVHTANLHIRYFTCRYSGRSLLVSAESNQMLTNMSPVGFTGEPQCYSFVFPQFACMTQSLSSIQIGAVLFHHIGRFEKSSSQTIFPKENSFMLHMPLQRLSHVHRVSVCISPQVLTNLLLLTLVTDCLCNRQTYSPTRDYTHGYKSATKIVAI